MRPTESYRMRLLKWKPEFRSWRPEVSKKRKIAPSKSRLVWNMIASSWFRKRISSSQCTRRKSKISSPNTPNLFNKIKTRLHSCSSRSSLSSRKIWSWSNSNCNLDRNPLKAPPWNRKNLFNKIISLHES